MNTNRKHLERLFTQTDTAPVTAAERRQYTRLAALLSQWRVLDKGVDLQTFSEKVSAHIREDVEYGGVDELIRNAAAPLPPVDWKALSSRISTAVRQEAQAAAGHKSRRTFAWTIRIATSLAAAAVIAIAVWGPRPDLKVAVAPTKQPKSSVFVSIEQPDNAGDVSIKFDEARPKNIIPENLAIHGSGIANGPSTVESVDIPIDPALLP